MALTRDGVHTILRSTREIRRMVGKFGATGISRRLGGPYLAAILALVDALNALEALDDYVQQIDRNPEEGDSTVEDGDTPVSVFGAQRNSGGTFGGSNSGGNF